MISRLTMPAILSLTTCLNLWRYSISPELGRRTPDDSTAGPRATQKAPRHKIVVSSALDLRPTARREGSRYEESGNRVAGDADGHDLRLRCAEPRTDAKRGTCGSEMAGDGWLADQRR